MITVDPPYLCLPRLLTEPTTQLENIQEKKITVPEAKLEFAPTLATVSIAFTLYLQLFPSNSIVFGIISSL